DGAAWQMRLRYAREPEPLGTAGAVRFAVEIAGVEGPLVVMNGDTFFSGALDRLETFHRARPGAAASMALVHVAEAGRYGTVDVDAETGLVRAFVEKGGKQGPAWINAGAYVIEPALMGAVPPGNVSLEHDVFPHRTGRDLYGCAFPDAAFLDI